MKQTPHLLIKHSLMIRRSYIDNNAGGQIHLAEAGQKRSDRPSILLIHQTPRSWDEFREVLSLLGSNDHLVAMDLPGMGASSPIGAKPTIEMYAEAAGLVAEHMGDDPIVVCGHHTGGVVAMEIAAKRSEMVASLVLSSTPWVDAKNRRSRSKKQPIDSIKASRDGYHLIDLWRQRSPYYPKKTEYMNRFMASAMQAENPVEGHFAVAQYHMEKVVENIECPVLIIEHMKDPFACKHTADLKAALPHAVVEYISDGQVALEITATKFAKILRQWVNPNKHQVRPQKLRVVK